MTNYYVQTLETSFPNQWGQNPVTGEKPMDSSGDILTSFLFDEDSTIPTTVLDYGSSYRRMISGQTPKLKLLTLS